MKFKNQKAERSKYRRISSSERAQIIHYLEDYKYSASHVSMITGHNASTVKAIYQVYKREGRVHKKDKRDQILRLKRKFLVLMVDDTNLSKITVDSHSLEDQVLREPQLKLKVTTDQAIETLLEKNKYKLMSLIDQPHSLKQFQQELKELEEQKNPTQQFSLLKLKSETHYIEGLEIKWTDQQKFSELKKKFQQSPILYDMEKVTTLLREQYCQMAHEA